MWPEPKYGQPSNSTSQGSGERGNKDDIKNFLTTWTQTERCELLWI